jgi:hypothetical protein
MPSYMRFVCTILAACLLGGPALAQVAPNPPSNLCIQSSGQTSCASSVAQVKKWNPGHYLRANALGFVAQDYARKAVYEMTRNDPNLKGGLLAIPWGTIETSKGVYDFSQIDKDLAILKSMGKKLIIEVWWQKYGGSVPDDRHFPRYIYDAGGVVAVKSDFSVRMDQAQWADRYIALQQALAAKYDADPAVEQVIITETASTSAYEFKRIVPAVAAAWHRTTVVLYMNWVDTAQLAQELMAICAQNGVGVGGPDILPPKPISPVGEDHASRALRGVGVSSLYSDGQEMQNFGTTDYRGQVPVSYSYEALHGIPPSAMISYVTGTLKATHIAWAVTEELGPTMNFTTGIVPVLNLVTSKLNLQYPSRLATAGVQ